MTALASAAVTPFSDDGTLASLVITSFTGGTIGFSFSVSTFDSAGTLSDRRFFFIAVVNGERGEWHNGLQNARLSDWVSRKDERKPIPGERQQQWPLKVRIWEFLGRLLVFALAILSDCQLRA